MSNIIYKKYLKEDRMHIYIKHDEDAHIYEVEVEDDAGEHRYRFFTSLNAAINSVNNFVKGKKKLVPGGWMNK